MQSFSKMRRINHNAHKPKQQDEIHNTPQNTPKDFQSKILNLQGLVGNQAVLQMMQDTPADLSSIGSSNLAIQRMPVRTEVIKKLGNPKRHKKNRKGEITKENSTKYSIELKFSRPIYKPIT